MAWRPCSKTSTVVCELLRSWRKACFEKAEYGQQINAHGLTLDTLECTVTVCACSWRTNVWSLVLLDKMRVRNGCTWLSGFPCTWHLGGTITSCIAIVFSICWFHLALTPECPEYNSYRYALLVYHIQRTKRERPLLLIFCWQWKFQESIFVHFVLYRHTWIWSIFSITKDVVGAINIC